MIHGAGSRPERPYIVSTLCRHRASRWRLLLRFQRLQYADADPRFPN